MGRELLDHLVDGGRKCCLAKEEAVARKAACQPLATLRVIRITVSRNADRRIVYLIGLSSDAFGRVVS